MKKQINKKIILIVFLSLLIPNLASAYIQSSFDIGGKYNPIYFQEVYDPYESRMDANRQQSNLNIQKENNLKSTYGVSNYIDCRIENESSCGMKVDMGNAYNMTSCLNFIQYCLERKAMNNSRSDVDLNNACIGKFGQGAYFSKRDSTGGTICGCKNGWNESRTVCLLPTQDTGNFFDKICQETSGIHSIYTGETDIDKNGGIGGCGCEYGFQFEYGNYGQCVIIPQKTNDQICQDDYGLNSHWEGTLNNDTGAIICDCESGYQWNQQNTSCIVTPAIPTKTNNQICNENYPNSYYNGVLNNQGGLTCDCKTGYVWEGDICVLLPEINPSVSKVKKEVMVSEVQEKPRTQEKSESNISNDTNLASVGLVKETATTTEKMKSKGLWEKIKNWFSFWK